jgi:hypothetical protein
MPTIRDSRRPAPPRPGPAAYCTSAGHGAARWSLQPDLVHRLVQRPAQRHVGFLRAAADGQQRHATRQHLADQRQGPGVARRVQRQGRVVHGLRPKWRGARWTATRSAARRRPVEQGVDVVGLGRGHHQRQGAGQPHGVDVLVAGDVEGVLAEPGCRPAPAPPAWLIDRSSRACPSVGTRPCPAPVPACAAAAPPGNGRCFSRAKTSKRDASPAMASATTARQAGQRQAVAREALQVVDLRHAGQAAEVGRAVHRDVDEAAPGVLHVTPPSCGKVLRHALAHRSAARFVPAWRAVADPPAVEHAVVGWCGSSRARSCCRTPPSR